MGQFRIRMQGPQGRNGLAATVVHTVRPAPLADVPGYPKES